MIADDIINFYHILLPKIPLDTLKNSLPYAEHIKQQEDGSITITVSSSASSSVVVQSIISFFDQKSLEFLETPKYYYKVDHNVRQSLLGWELAFEGCLAVLLFSDEKLKPFLDNSWELINSTAGGIFLSPYTLFLYEDHPKIIHPVTVRGYDARKAIEHTTSLFIRRMVSRISEAQPGLEGIAILSMVEEKTGLSAKEISTKINNKVANIKNPVLSPFFIGLYG